MKLAGLVLLVIWLLVHCQSKYEKMQGHWHMISDQENGELISLDIDDSLAIIDYYSHVGININYTELFSDYEDIPNRINVFRINDDTLFDPDWDRIYIKKNIADCLESHYFSDLMVNIFPDSCDNNSYQADKIKKEDHFSFSFINIGTELNHWTKIDQKNSFYIQVNDVLIPPTRIPDFLLEEKLSLHNEVVLCLNIDKATPQQFIDSVYAHLIPYLGSSDLYHSCYNPKSREVELIKINVGDLNY